MGSNGCEVEVEGPPGWVQNDISVFAGICGELWLIPGFSGICLGLLADACGVSGSQNAVFLRENVDKTWLQRGC